MGFNPVRIFALLLVLAAGPVMAEGPVQVDSTGALLPRVGQDGNPQTADGPVNGAKGGGGVQLGAAPASDEPAALDYTAWEAMGSRAETAIEDAATTSVAMELLRSQLVDWRSALLGAQSANSARIVTLRTQIAALGPVPAEGQIEADEIARRRSELNDQLVRLQAPGIAAEEAYQRADGLIREIDRVMRDRQADQLLQLWPMPINPANWPSAARALSDTAVALYTETARRVARPIVRERFVDTLPMVLVLLVLAIAVLWRGRRWIDRITYRVQNRATVQGRRLWAFLASLGQILVPFLGVMLLTTALERTELLGVVGSVVVAALPGIGFTFFAAIWLGGRSFPVGERAFSPLNLSAERRAEGRFLAAASGFLLGIEALRRTMMNQMAAPESAVSVLSFPILVLMGVVLVRMAQLMQCHVRNETKTDEPVSYGTRMVMILSKAAFALGVTGPILGAVGYVSAANAMLFPAILSLALVALLSIMQQLAVSLYAMAIKRPEEEAEAALVPVLVGFILTLASLPAFALIWGARTADLTELWQRFREGVQLGDTRISPTAFLYFAAIFAIGYFLTRAFQGALRSSILPRTEMDQGGQNAIVSGVGYIGIFLAALVAINSAGIDLSGLAIVAGALSVGIGFGLQAVVSNFVSGIILLIERPVTEGDWIEVGGVQGTVKAISVRSTRIQTFDRSDVIVPNSDLISGRVTNFTRFNLSGRLTVPVGVAYGSDSRKVEAILRDIAEAQPLAVLNPPPTIAFQGFGADSMNFEIRVILRDVNFQLAVRTEINHQIVERFAVEGIEIPFAQTEISLRNVDALGEVLGRLPALAGAEVTSKRTAPANRARRVTTVVKDAKAND